MQDYETERSKSAMVSRVFATVVNSSHMCSTDEGSRCGGVAIRPGPEYYPIHTTTKGTIITTISNPNGNRSVFTLGCLETGRKEQPAC
jgi:hypothetical protein